MTVLYRTEVVIGMLGATAVGLYACVLFDRQMRFRYQKMYVDSVVKMFDLYMRKRRVFNHT